MKKVLAILVCAIFGMASYAWAGPSVSGGTSSAATSSAAGIIETCTDAEYTAGVKTDCAGTPANAKVELDKRVPIPTASIDDGLLLVKDGTGTTGKFKAGGVPITMTSDTTGMKNYDTTADTWEDATIVKTIYLPVAYFEDGAAPPAAASVLASTRKVKTRAFDGASNENLEVSFTVPVDYSSGIKFRFIGYVPGATAPAENEVVAFSFAACSNGNSDALGCSAGTAQTSSLTAAAGYAQYDRLAGAWSNAITVTDIAAGETVQGILIRLAESTDTYAQDFALAGIEIKYVATFIMGSAY